MNRGAFNKTFRRKIANARSGAAKPFTTECRDSNITELLDAQIDCTGWIRYVLEPHDALPDEIDL